MIIWGKRTYGAVNKVGDIAVKTVFGHLYFLPLLPMASYYVNRKTDESYEMNCIDWRSVLMGYVRVYGPIVALLFALAANHSEPVGDKVFQGLVALVAAAAVIASYVLDKKMVKREDTQVRQMMDRHFGVAIDPYACLTNMHMAIDERMQALNAAPVEHSWYKRTMGDLFSPRQNVELALLRARCDQQDKPLQETALKMLRAMPAAA